MKTYRVKIDVKHKWVVWEDVLEYQAENELKALKMVFDKGREKCGPRCQIFPITIDEIME